MSTDFTEQQRRFVLDTVERLRRTTGAGAEARFDTVHGMDRCELWVHDLGRSGASARLASIVGIPAGFGAVEFSVRDSEGEQVGPEDRYSTLEEALVHADVLIRRMIAYAKAQPVSATTADAVSSPFTRREVEPLYEFSQEVAHAAGNPCTIKIKDLMPGAMAIGFYFAIGARPVLVASMVVTRADSGSIVGSLKGFDRREVIAQTFFPDVPALLEASRPYFNSCVAGFRRANLRGSLIGRLRAAVGL